MARHNYFFIIVMPILNAERLQIAKNLEKFKIFFGILVPMFTVFKVVYCLFLQGDSYVLAPL